jgi:gamma-glutamyltranspeptidase/glutathione hydrolase
MIASQVGAAVIRSGGNAIDAAIATSFAVCVVNPSSCGIGGGGFMLIYLADEKKAVALDYRETAPSAASRTMFVRKGKVDPEASRRGGLAVAVPGEVAGLAEIATKYGTRSLAQLIQPATRLARNGFPIGKHLAQTIAENVDAIRKSPKLAARFLKKDGTPLAAGDPVQFPELAATLERIAKEGPQAFYSGDVAAAIVTATRAAGGILTEADLRNYRPVWRDPIHLDFHGYDVIAMPPPSSAGVLLEMLGILGDDDLRGMGRQSPAYLHLLAEAMQHAFADRAHFYGDPASVDVPVHSCCRRRTRRHCARRSKADGTPRAGRLRQLGHHHGASRRSRYVAPFRRRRTRQHRRLPTTINTAFGSFVVAGDTGIILNNEMDDFSAQPGAPNTFGWSAAKPTPSHRQAPAEQHEPDDCYKDGEAVFAAGGSGGPLILSGTLQVLLNSLVFDLSAEDAVAAPRIHHQWKPPALMVEPDIAESAQAALKQDGHTVKTVPSMGAVQLVRRGANKLEAAADPRKSGGAMKW